MTLADIKTKHDGQYHEVEAKLVWAGVPMMNWQPLTLRDKTGDYEVSTFYNPDTPDMEVPQDMVGKVHRFRVKAYQKGNFTNMYGNII